jgi:GNAT superfamily N-acetyltransferase
VAFDADEPVGIAGGMDGWSPDASERELVGMWVAQDQRGRGVAAHLLQAVVSWAAAQGATGLTLGVRPDNQVARATYLKLGLQPTGRTVRSTTDPAVSVEVMGMPVPPSLG